MKKYAAFLFILQFAFCIFNSALAQDKPVKIKPGAVPDTVLGSYRAKYKKTPVDQWYQVGELYKAEFAKAGMDAEALFSADGQWIQTATLMDKSSLSAKIKKQIETDYTGWKVYKAEKVDVPDSTNAKQVFVTIKKSSEKQLLRYTPKGLMLEAGQ